MRLCWTWTPPTTRFMAIRKDGSITATTATIAICPYTFSLGSICCVPGCGAPIIDGADGSIDELERIVGQIRRSWPDVSIIIRADSGFCRDELLSWCEAHQVGYVVGLAKNNRLKREIAEQMTQAEAAFTDTGKPARVFKDFRYRTRDSWSCERRVIGKAEFLEKGANPRFVVTSLSPERLDARALYEDFGSSAEFVGKTVFHRRLRRPRCSPSLKASLASSAAAPALTLGCAPRCRLVWAMGNGASGGGSGHRV